MTSSRVAQRLWQALSLKERIERLQPLVDVLIEQMDGFAALISTENGKPRVEAVGHEIVPSVAQIKWLFAEAPKILATKSVGLTWLPHRQASIARRPHGVVLVISPWNVPLAIPFGHVVAALIAGNAVVLKPSEVTPRTAEIIETLCAACDLPEGLFRLVQGDGAVGAQLIKAGPDKILFTGSVATGKKVMRAAAAGAFPIPVTLELGGVDAVIARADADLEFTSSAVAWGATFNGGQVCASVERLLVHESIYDQLLDRIRDKLERIDVRQDMGRITFEGQRAVYDRHLDDARKRGLEMLCGGDYVDGDRLRPTLIKGAGIERAAVYNEETFGPVLAARSFRDDDEAVLLHNDTNYGLTASIFTRDTEGAQRLAERLHCGLVSINEIGATLFGQPELPWGGVRGSGFGRCHGAEGLLDLTWSQVIERARVPRVELKRLWWYPYSEQQEKAFRLFAQLIGARSLQARAALSARLVKAAASLMSHAPRL